MENFTCLLFHLLHENHFQRQVLCPFVYVSCLCLKHTKAAFGLSSMQEVYEIKLLCTYSSETHANKPYQKCQNK